MSSHTLSYHQVKIGTFFLYKSYVLSVFVKKLPPYNDLKLISPIGEMQDKRIHAGEIKHLPLASNLNHFLFRQDNMINPLFYDNEKIW